MKIVDIVQNSDKWYEYRKTRIGASDFNTFCKFKGWYTPYYKIKKDDTLENHFYNKINNVQFTNQFIERGKQLEPQLLEDYNILTGGCYVPTVIEYDSNPLIFASLDGYDVFTNRIVEKKTTAKHPSFEKQLLESYMCQCIHQMICSNIDIMVITINYYNYGITKHYTIYKDGGYKCYFLDNLLVSIHWGFDCWRRISNEYLDLLHNFINKEATNGGA